MAGSRNVIESVVWSLELIELLGRARTPVSFTDIARHLRKPKSSVHRMLLTLEGRGFIERCSLTKRYRLTGKLWTLAFRGFGTKELAGVALPFLQQLMKETEETVNLAVLVDGETKITYIANVESPRIVRVCTPVGFVAPAWCTATGRCMLAFRPDTWGRVLKGPLPKLTPATLTDPSQLRALLQHLPTKGFAVTRGERDIEFGGIAAPVRNHLGEVVAASGVAVPVFRLTKEVVNRYAKQVMATAALISRELGYAGTVRAETHAASVRA